MLRAGALFVAVTISFVIAVLISLLIILSFHYKTQYRENLLQKKLERNVNSAVTWLMNDASVSGDQAAVMDLYEEGADSVLVRKISWGAFEIAGVKAFSGRYSLSRTVQYGYQPDGSFSPAVYMPDYSNYLTISGKTILRGTCFLPERKGGLVKDMSSSTVFHGIAEVDIQKSKNELPALEVKMLKQLSSFLTNNSASLPGYTMISLDKDSLMKSFLDTTVMITSSSDLSLTGKYLSGNVIVVSQGTITVGVNSTMEDVLLFAPVIRFQQGFKGNVQAFATDSIVVESDCVLRYPSVLGVFKKENKLVHQAPYIRLKENAVVSGVVFTSQYLYTDLQMTRIELSKGSRVHGHVYGDGFVDLKGTVEGMVWCRGFKDKTGDDHLMDAVIDRTKLSVHYAGSSLVASGKRKKIIKWLE